MNTPIVSRLKFSIASASLAFAACSTTPKTPVRSAQFAVKQEVDVKVPAGTKQLRMWMVLPQVDHTEDVAKLEVQAPVEWRETKDSEGNRMLYLEASAPFPESFTVVQNFEVQRREQTGAID